MIIKEIKCVDDFNNIIKNNKKVLIKFYSVSCAPCRKLLSLLEKETDFLIPIYKLDAIEMGILSDLYSISAVPTILYFVDGKPIHKFHGIIGINKIKEIIHND